jgi:hypothetical protein
MNMEPTTIYTVLITLVTVLGSGAAWRYYERRAINKERTENFLKDDCKERIMKMEILLERSSQEKEEMRSEILRLTAEVSELRIKVEFLARENNDLYKRLRD